MTRMLRPLCWAGALIVLTFFGAGGWAALAPLESAVVAPGNVRVEGETKAVQHQEGGTVRQVLAQDGDLVAQGQPLVVLDETEARAGLMIQQVALVRAWARESRLRAERSAAADIDFPPELEQIAAATESVHLLEGERGLFVARQQRLQGQLEILDEQVAQYERKIGGLRSQAVAQERQLELLQKQATKYEALFAKQFIGEPQLMETRVELARLEGERGEYVAEIAEARQAIAERKLEMLQLRKEFAETTEEQLRETESAVLDHKERIKAARHTLERLTIVAPASGYLVNNVVRGPGQVVGPGETLMEVVPNRVDLIIEARVAQSDVDQVAAGQLADVRFTSLDSRDTPILEGRVRYLSADLIQDEQTREAFFVTRIGLEEDQLEKLAGYRLQAGVSAEVVIKTGGRTVMDYLVKPLSDYLARAFRES